MDTTKERKFIASWELYPVLTITSNTLVISSKDGIIHEKPLYFFLERYLNAYKMEIEILLILIINNKENARYNRRSLSIFTIGQSGAKIFNRKQKSIYKRT